MDMWSPILEIQFLPSIYFDFVHMRISQLGPTSIPSTQFRRKKTRFSLATPTWQLQLCDRWIFLNFVGMMIILFPCLLYEVGDVDDSGLKWPQHQEWYENSKCIGTHLGAMKSWELALNSKVGEANAIRFMNRTLTFWLLIGSIVAANWCIE